MLSQSHGQTVPHFWNIGHMGSSRVMSPSNLLYIFYARRPSGSGYNPLPMPVDQMAPATSPLPMPVDQLAPATSPLPIPVDQLAQATSPLPMPVDQLAPARSPLPMPVDQLAPATRPLSPIDIVGPVISSFQL